MNSPITVSLTVILIAMVLVKLLVIMAKPQAWLQLARSIYRHQVRVRYGALTLAALVLWLLLLSGLDIVQIMAVSLFVSLLLMVGFAPFAPHLLDWAEGRDFRQLLRQQALYTAVWLALLAWAGITLFRANG